MELRAGSEQVAGPRTGPGGYITNAEPILLVGNPGLGKTHVATGLALAACRQGLRVRFYNVAGLVNDLLVAQKELRLSRFLNQVGKVQAGGAG